MILLTTVTPPNWASLICTSLNRLRISSRMAVHRRPSEAQGAAVDFQTVPELQQFVIRNVGPTGRELGRGSYGTVKEVEIPGATCAAKVIHETLLQFGSEDEVRNITEKFVRECCLMSSLRHPHVVQFLGVCFLPGSRLPALVMEKLLVSLHELLETNPNIPLATKRSILHNVARGLLYIHSRNPPIIHRDLTAKNVLLNSAMVAKLADLGVARIVESRPGQMAAQLTQAPGTAVYMPPEALEPAGTYDTKLDIFSFGNVALFTLTQAFPAQLKYPIYIDPTTRRRIARSEVERRSDYIQQMHEHKALGRQHILVRIVEQCLQDLPEDRPSIEEVIQQLEKARTQIPSQYGEMTRLELEQEIQSLQVSIINCFCM